MLQCWSDSSRLDEGSRGDGVVVIRIQLDDASVYNGMKLVSRNAQRQCILLYKAVVPSPNQSVVAVEWCCASRAVALCARAFTLREGNKHQWARSSTRATRKYSSKCTPTPPHGARLDLEHTRARRLQHRASERRCVCDSPPFYKYPFDFRTVPILTCQTDQHSIVNQVHSCCNVLTTLPA